ncbi:MAG: hypothetical protein MJK04_19060 [Psychrosphaera sp.]|nr:hypothetical protein [Psychrosphaera sp.]
MRHYIPLFISAFVLSGCIGGLLNPDLAQYNSAMEQGEFKTQIALASKIIKADPGLIDLTGEQISQAKVSYARLNKAQYQFADALERKDAQAVLVISPNLAVAIRALKANSIQTKQKPLIAQQLKALHQLETHFSEKFHLNPLHKKVTKTSVTLPSFAGKISAQYYLGAFNKKLNGKVLTDYQVQQLVNHQNNALKLAITLNAQLTTIEKTHKLSAALTRSKTSLTQIIALHHQTMNHLLVSLIRDGMKAADKSFNDLSKVAGSQMTRGNHEEVWAKIIGPLTHKQWPLFKRTYLIPINIVRQAMLTHKDKTNVYDVVLSQTFPHAEVTYKYFWPKDKLGEHFEQGKARMAEAAKINKVLDGITFDDFSGIDQSYLALSQ